MPVETELLMRKPSLPDSIKALFNSSFKLFPLIAQVATIEMQMPRIRSMALFALWKEAFPLFLTHTSSPKWESLQKDSQVSICIINEEKDKQIIGGGHAVLHTRKTNEALIEKYWPLVPHFVQPIYGCEMSSLHSKSPDSFGVITIVTNFWEQLIFDPINYANSIRIQYHYQNQAWHSSSCVVC